MCTCVCIFMYACTRMYIMCGPDTYVYICTYNIDHRHAVCMYILECTYVCVYLCMYMHTSVYICLYIVSIFIVHMHTCNYRPTEGQYG